VEIYVRVLRRAGSRYSEEISGVIDGREWWLMCRGEIGAGRSAHEYEIDCCDGDREQVVESIVPTLTYGEGLSL